jgi:hypothetical protein
MSHLLAAHPSRDSVTRCGMKKGIVCSLLLYLSCTSGLRAQEFQNLDFESANVSNLPSGQSEFVSVADGLPGWTAYIGTNQLTQVGHNVITIGGADVGIWGPDYGFGFPPLQGTYTAILQPGPFIGQGPSVSIAQTGLIPASAKSMQFLASLAYTNDLIVTIGGQIMPVIPLGSGAFGCDVSMLTDSVEEIEFTIAGTHGNDLNFLDAITFSPEVIPEPSSLSLVLVGVACVAFWQRTRRRMA